MTKAELMSLVGHKVRVKLFDDEVYEGELLYFDKLETIYGTVFVSEAEYRMNWGL